MNSRKKIINELRFQLDSKEVKDQHYPVQLSVSDANAILALLKEQEAVSPKRIIMSPNDWFCGECGVHLSRLDNCCPRCGKVGEVG